MVQDVWWWNVSAIPEAHAIQAKLCRPSVKSLSWCGEPTCYRNQSNVLWTETDSNKMLRQSGRCRDKYAIGGQHQNERTISEAAAKRGGVTPYNLLPIPGANGGHGASTPLELADWWVRYICPPGGTVVDPFDGVGTMMLAALKNGCNGIGIERDAGYHEIAKSRIEKAQLEMVQGKFAT